MVWTQDLHEICGVLLGVLFVCFGHTIRHARSQFPDHGSNLCPS